MSNHGEIMMHQEIAAILAQARVMDAQSAAFQYAQGAEWKYDEDCDCPRCTDYRDAHCQTCGGAHQWHGRDEADRHCPSCRYTEDAVDLSLTGDSALEQPTWDHEDDWRPGR